MKTRTWNMLSRAIERRLPGGLRCLVLHEDSSIEAFVREAAGTLPAGGRVLDAGAGSMPYRRLFGHAAYESADFEDMFDPSRKAQYTYVCSLERIPVADGSFHMVICTQVLEHVPRPGLVLKELQRVLRPGGCLCITVPQGWGLHGEPYHFFNFTCHGLRMLLEEAGLRVEHLTPRGGIFWYLGERIRILPRYLFDQCGPFTDAERPARSVILALPMGLLYLLLELVLGYGVPLVCHLLDTLDRRRAFTLGYACRAVKAGGEG